MGVGDRPIVPFAFSGLAFGTSAAAACCFLTVWSYWYFELDANCATASDCKCVLFGTSYSSGGFVGGERYVCRYAYYSTLASAALAASACSYYGCKWLLCPKSRGRRRRDHRPVSSAPPDTSSQITGLKICFACLLGLMALNMFIVSIVLTNGYISTCLQYVHRVKSILMASGNMIELVTNRMSCGTIYDFMDYLQPPSQQVKYELIHRHKPNPRESIINTSGLLIVSIIMSWLNTLIWIMFTFCTYYFK